MTQNVKTASRQITGGLNQIFAVIVSVQIYLAAGLPCLAQGITKNATPLEESVAPAVRPSSPSGPTDHQELETFVDRFFAEQLAKHIPGAVFVLVKDGRVFFSKGYGYADLENRTPVSPEKTLFRVASLSKLFTATAVMQLVERARLNLSDDITRYLGKLPVADNGFPPVAVSHLLTHTDGFDKAWSIGAATRCEAALPSLQEFLRTNLPARILPPGEVYLYGDAGMALAGRLVEVLSGMPFIDYADKNILQPLAMRHSSFRQPLPPHLAADLAVGYGYEDGAFHRKPFTCGKSVPTIGMSASATDLAHFMLALLQGGRYGATRILQPATVRAMFRPAFTNFPNGPRTPGATYALYERFRNKERVLEHGGSVYGYTSRIFLMPERNLGFFVAYNDNNLEDTLREDLLEQFLDHYYPGKERVAPLPSAAPRTDVRQWFQEMNGSYRLTQHSRHSLVKLAEVLFDLLPEFRVQAGSDGTITLFPGGTRWVEVQPWVFQYPGSNSYITFRQDAQGRISTMSLSGYVYWTYEKLAWYETKNVQFGLAVFWTLLFLSACWVWPIRVLVFARSRQPARTRATQRAQILAGLIGIMSLVFVVGFLLLTFQINSWEFFFGAPPILIALLCLPILTTGLATGLPILALLAWQDKHWPLTGRVHYLLLILATLAFIFSLSYWNVLGFRF
jgi:CubicO group peptidase (beta-lactamase class C family)